MRVQLAQQAQDLLGKSDLVIITERVDDVALLIGQMVKMGEVYAWPQDLMRCDATPIAGAHEVAAGGLLQCGQRKEEPTRPQSKVMRGSLDPLGMPLATNVLSGERADEGLDIPSIERMRSGLCKTGLLFVGACKRSALDIRASRARPQDWYLSPLPLTGATAEAMDAWVTAGVTQGEAGE